MASAKDALLEINTPRPGSVHTNSRPHAHSVSLGALNNVHRVSRRKSSSSMAGVNLNAISAAARDMSTEGPARVKVESIDGVQKNASPLTSSSGMGRPKSATAKGSAILDGPPLSSMLNDKSKARGRRASEGSRLSRTERRRSTMAGESLRCEQCGKSYKHGSCLTKHLWEHTPEWSLTSKLLISKHQQVQLLEAASVLMSMNTGSSATNESAIQESGSSGESPAASGPSDKEEESSRTSTPSHEGDVQYKPIRPATRPSRQDSYNSAFSRSYASTSAHSFAASSAPTEPTDMYWYRSSPRRRPSSSSQSFYSGDDQADVAAAAEGLVSCSLGTPKTGASQLADDIPPVPPLPAQFAQHASRPVSLHKSYQADVDMREVPERDGDDEGVFGVMDR